MCVLRVLTLVIAGALCVVLAECSPSIRYSHRPGRYPGNEPKKQISEINRTMNWERLDRIAESYIGTRYHRGGTNRHSGLDCSGLTILIYDELTGVRLPRKSSAMRRTGIEVSKDDLAPGDLVFFTSGFFGDIDHVGIYLGDDRFIHSSSSKGVMYSKLSEDYFVNHYAGARRIE